MVINVTLGWRFMRRDTSFTITDVVKFGGLPAIVSKSY